MILKKGFCKLCGKKTHEFKNNTFRRLCNDCFKKYQRPEDKHLKYTHSRFIIQCSICEKESIVTYTSFFPRIKKSKNNKNIETFPYDFWFHS